MFSELSKHIKCKEDAVIRGLQRKNESEEKKPRITTNLLPSSLRLGPVLGSKHAEVKSFKSNGRKPTLELKPRPSSKHKVIESKLFFLGAYYTITFSLPKIFHERNYIVKSVANFYKS